MTSTPFTDFIAFVECERSIYLTEKLKERELAAMQALMDNITDETQRIDAIKAHLSSLKTKVHHYEFDIKDRRARKKELGFRLDTVSNPKEYTAITKEIQDLEAKEAALEEELFSTWQTAEAAQSDYESKLENFIPWRAEIQSKIDEKRKHNDKLEKELEALKTQKIAAEALVKPEFLHDYYQMRLSVPDPVVPVENNHCSACQYQISLNDLQQIRRHVLVPCRECFRKLYAL